MSFVYYPSAQPRHKTTPRLIFILLSIAIFFSCHWPFETQTSVADYNVSQEVIVSDVSAGSIVRELALITMGTLSIFSLVQQAHNHPLRLENRLGWLLIGFIAWAALSVSWADDRSMTAKRLVSFSVLWLVSIAVVRSFTLLQSLLWTFWTTAVFLLSAILVELVTGVFHPLVAGYRFSGIQHPNAEGTECGLLFLSSLACARLDRKRRRLYTGIGVVAFLFLILTVSRTALGATLLSVTVWSIATGSQRVRRRVLAGALILAAIVGIFVLSGAYKQLESKLFPGRDEAGSAESFAGRTEIWKDVTPFIEERPVLGYGFGGFWTPLRIGIISDNEQWGVPDSHSAYFDYLLALGSVGLALYVLCLLGGVTRAFDLLRRTRNPHFAYCAALLVFCIVDGTFESAVSEGSVLTFLAFVSLARLAFIPVEAYRAPVIQGRAGQQEACAA